MKYGKIIIGTICSVAIIVALIILFMTMQGETKTFGENPENINAQSLICTSGSINYPIFTHDNSTRKDLTITTSFYDDALRAISLKHILYYNDADQIKASETHNHAAMNKSFGKDNLGADALGAVYSELSDSMKMNLYITANGLDQVTAKYFMVNAQDDDKHLPTTLTEYKNNYETQGFICETDK